MGNIGEIEREFPKALLENPRVHLWPAIVCFQFQRPIQPNSHHKACATMSDELIFCGENRKADLRRLKRAFDDVAAAAQALHHDRKGNHGCIRITLIEAERGLGKTRLAMELFRHLTTTCDPDEYWPDTYRRERESVEVMPPAETCDVARTPSFVWWGMGIPDGPNPGNTVFATLEDVLPHLISSHLAARRAQSGKEFLAEAADVAVDLGIEFGAEISGLGLVKRLGQSALRIGSLVNRHTGETPKASDQIDSVVDAVMSDLTRLFSPLSRQFAGIPLVIFIDDAQFADRDPAMAAFVERLIARGTREKWPLLVMLTHWSRQLRPWVDAAGNQHQPSHIASVLDHALAGTPETPGPFAGESGGSLPKESFMQIDLGEPVEGLEIALREKFGGISEEDVTAIVDKSGGNPRKLDQIVARMERKPLWFEQNNLETPLTEAGRKSVMELSDLPIEEVVLERFSDTPDDIRRSMIMASLMGNRFVVDLVDRLARARLSSEARTGLEDCERSYRFLRDVLDRSRNDIGAFAERLFFDAAREYHESRMAKYNLPNWPEDDELMTALDILLKDLVTDPDSFDNLREDDLVEALSLAGTRMEGSGEPQAGLALARLVAIENGRGNAEGGYAAALRFIAGFRS